MAAGNIELARMALDAFNRRDFDAFLELMDPEIELKARFMELEGDPSFRGFEGVREWWQALLAIFPDFHVEVREARDLGESIVLALRVRGHGSDSGVPVDEEVWQTARSRDGKVTWWRNFATEAEAMAAAGERD